jgi:hypothetical protein
MQVYTTFKQKDEITNEWLQGKGRMKRKAKVTGNEEINEVVWEWFTNATSKNIRISGPMVQSEALAVARSLGNGQFEASTDGWIVLRRATILCETESVGNLRMWMTV